MIKNYFYLNRFAVELSTILKQFILVEAFSQDRDKIIFEFNNNDKNLFIEICVNPGFPYINLRENFHRAKKNTIGFFGNNLPARFVETYIAKSDRLIKISFDNMSIYFAVRGKYTNVIAVDNKNQCEVFKKYDDDKLKDFIEELGKTDFISGLHFPAVDVFEDGLFLDIVKKKYPYLGKEIFMEFISRENPGSKKALLLNQVIDEARYNSPSLRIDKKSFKISLLPEHFHSSGISEMKGFDTIIEAFNYYIYKYYQFEEIRNKTKLIDRHLSRELTRFSTKLNNLKARIEKGSRDEEFNKIGNLLLINLNSIRKGMDEIEVEDIYKGENRLKIKIDPELSSKQNSDRYFEKARNDKISLAKSKQLYSETESKYLTLQSLSKIIESNPSVKQLNKIMKELKIKDDVHQEEKEDIGKKFKQYLINNKYRLYVGRDSKNNDLLTTKFAKQNDYWFHARSVSGSHVVLRIDNSKEAVPKDVLKKAASVAAYHSKAKTAGLVPVTYCFKKYVVKRKGMPVGQVALLKEETLLVRPEIPDKCEFIPQ